MSKVSNDIIVGVSSAIIAPLYLTPLYFTDYVESIGLIPLIYTAISGILYTIPLIFYILALRRDDPAVVSPMFRLTPAFTVILAALVLGQIVSTKMYIGILIILLGVFLVSINKDTIEKFSFSPAIYYAVIATILFAISNIFIELSLQYMNVWSFLFYSRITAFIPAVFLLFLPSSRESIKEMISSPGESGFLRIFINKSFENLGSIFYAVSVSLGPVAVVSTITSMESIFVVIFAIIYAYKNYDRPPLRQLMRQAIASVLVVSGVALIYF